MQNETPAPGRAVPAVVRGPFNPVAYVLIDGHLLLPAIWPDSAGPAPAAGEVVTVRLPDGRPTPQMLPLTAWREPPEPAPPAAAPPDDPVQAAAAIPEPAAIPEQAAEQPDSAQQPESQEAS